MFLCLLQNNLYMGKDLKELNELADKLNKEENKELNASVAQQH